MKKLFYLAIMVFCSIACQDQETNKLIDCSTPYLMEVLPTSEFTLNRATGGSVVIEIEEDCYVYWICEKGRDIDFSDVFILGSDEEDHIIVYSHGWNSSEDKDIIPWRYDRRDWYEVRQSGLRTLEIECYPCEDDRSLKLYIESREKAFHHAIVKVSLLPEQPAK